MRVDGSRLYERLMQMAQIGGTPKGGVCRVALTDEDKRGRELFVKWCREAGCSIHTDALGNIFARREGRDSSLPAVLIGSHLDSQPTGGKYDGVYGVLAGLEVIETLNRYEHLTDSPIEIVSWTNEEGARFTPAMIASGVFGGAFTLDYAYSRKDDQGKSLKEELGRIGFLGDDPVGAREYKASFEVHIEQGPVLEANDVPIGIVTGVQGIVWYELTIKGQETHAGPCPMSMRKDPVQGLVKALGAIYQLGAAHGEEARVTIGKLHAEPGVVNTVPGNLDLTIDLRHPSGEKLKQMQEGLNKIISDLERDTGLDFGLQQIWKADPVHFDSGCIEAVRQAVVELKLDAKEMVSGAGHDAVYVANKVPTSMIFIPCKDGLSHNEAEHADKEHIIAGADVLLHAVLKMAENTNK
ncbi:Zn-dependent hydrolase [Robertkochia aurantiaca]|uniref:Zn-dependent hydrolase n=1 Tax=Robertkochia aurantiaca TaxID=2873700 RepID=UPI001CC8F561|nr:Zn-dependent hydrolase [Robertkochia sp. 3YJGBD-33]